MIHNQPPFWLKRLLLGILLVTIVLPRVFALDRFVTPDEPAWLGRSVGFYAALVQRDFQNTFQHGHPGVTITWAGTAALLLKYRAVAWEAGPAVLKNWKNLEDFLKQKGLQALEILKTARLLMVLGNTLVLGLAFICSIDLIGIWPSFIGFILIALDPFYIGLSRLLHLDALMTSFMLLASLAYMNYLWCGRRFIYLFLAILAAALSWLTKSPAIFLIPFFVLLTLFELMRTWRERGHPRLKEIWNIIRPVGIWLIGSVLVFVIIWPSMWVDPIGTLSGVFNQAVDYAAEGHASVIFFNGRIIEGDPGWLFYPLTYLWRTTPSVLVGLGLLGIAVATRRKSFNRLSNYRASFFLLTFAILFTLMMNTGAKKFDRYILPTHAALDILAGLGFVVLSDWLREKRLGRGLRWGFVFLPLVFIGWQGLLAVQTYPYYLSYYNPLMGGSKKATQVMMIGWGEGLDQAGRYLSSIPGSEELRVMSPYPDGSFSYFFNGEALPPPEKWEGIDSESLIDVDYLVIYIHQWQRQQPDPALLSYFAGQTPEYIVRINHLEYAQVYKLHP